MFVFVKRKIQNKKCLNGCLLLGITLLIAVASCTPMFQKGSLNMLLRSKFETVITERAKIIINTNKRLGIKNPKGLKNLKNLH